MFCSSQSSPSETEVKVVKHESNWVTPLLCALRQPPSSGRVNSKTLIDNALMPSPWLSSKLKFCQHILAPARGPWKFHEQWGDQGDQCPGWGDEGLGGAARGSFLLPPVPVKAHAPASAIFFLPKSLSLLQLLTAWLSAPTPTCPIWGDFRVHVTDPVNQQHQNFRSPF